MKLTRWHLDLGRKGSKESVGLKETLILLLHVLVLRPFTPHGFNNPAQKILKHYACTDWHHKSWQIRLNVFIRFSFQHRLSLVAYERIDLPVWRKKERTELFPLWNPLSNWQIGARSVRSTQREEPSARSREKGERALPFLPHSCVHRERKERDPF